MKKKYFNKEVVLPNTTYNYVTKINGEFMLPIIIMVGDKKKLNMSKKIDKIKKQLHYTKVMLPSMTSKKKSS